MIAKGAAISPDLTYEEALARSTGSSSAVTIEGRIVARASSGIYGPKGCTPILWCLCVHDSPDNPCPCTGPIIWIPDRFLRAKRKARHGEEGAIEFDLDGKTRIFLEDSREVGTIESGTRLLRKSEDGQLEAVTDTLWVQEFIPMRINTLKRALLLIEGHPQLSAMAKKKGKGFWGKIVAAFEAGWAIGEFIDEETGLSDKISDWMIDTFGPWPW